MEAADEAVICRMRLGPLKVDFMPDNEAILGFSNRWYATGIETAVTRTLADDLEIRVLTPAIFVATKLEAFEERGQNDLFMSLDAEDNRGCAGVAIASQSLLTAVAEFITRSM